MVDYLYCTSACDVTKENTRTIHGFQTCFVFCGFNLWKLIPNISALLQGSDPWVHQHMNSLACVCYTNKVSDF